MGGLRSNHKPCAGVTNEGLRVAAIGLEHFETAVSGHIGDLDQVGRA